MISADSDLPGRIFEKVIELFRSDPFVEIQDVHQEVL